MGGVGTLFKTDLADSQVNVAARPRGSNFAAAYINSFHAVSGY